MDKDRRPASFVSRWTRRRPPAERDDPADYGTAFGLDLTLSASHPAVQEGASERLPHAPAWWSRWWHRAG